VVDWARANLFAVIRGNHDRACCGLEDLEWFNPVARSATLWTMEHLSEENLEYLRLLPAGPIALDDFLLAHGSPLDEDEYIASNDDASNLYPYLEYRLTFFGHTHLQGGFKWIDGCQRAIARPDRSESGIRIRLDPESTWLINPGSVGQPRDGDARAAYAVFDSEKREVLLGRASYDHESVRQKIDSAGLPPILGARLALGR